MKRLIFSICLLLIVAAFSRAATVTVPGDFSTIDSAINGSATGDTILVAPGTYTEMITFDGKDLVITGDVADPSTTIIDGTTNTYVARMVNGETSAAVLEGFTISGGTYGCTLSQQANGTIRNCILTNALQYPIYITGGGVNLSNNTYTGNGTEAIYVGAGNLSKSVNYTNDGIPYYMFNSINIWAYDGNPIPRLTIDPGTSLQFQVGTSLQVGNISNRYGELYAVGTALEPITFTAMSGVPGGWVGLIFNDGSDYTTSTSTLEYCTIEYAGGGLTNPSGVLLATTNQPTFINSSVNNCLGNAMRMNTGSHFALVDNISMTGNESNTIGVGGHTYTSDFTFDANGIPYEILDDLDVWAFAGNPIPRITIAPGNTLKFAPTTGLRIGNISNRPGELYAVGTVSEPIIFTASNGVAGSWDGIAFWDGSDYTTATSIMDYCTVELAGDIGWGYSAGVICYSTFQPTITNSTIQNCDGYAVWSQGVSFNTMNNNVITGNTYDAIGMSGRTVQESVTLVRNDAPYYVMGHFYLWQYDNSPATPVLTIEAGAEILFAETIGMQIGNITNRWGELVAIGTELEPIIFGPINGLPGGWGGLNFAPGSDHLGSTSTLEYCRLKQGGYPLWGAAPATLSVQETNQPAISNCTFTGSSDYPVYIQSDARIAFGSGNTYAANGIQAIAFEGRTMNSDYTIIPQSIPYHVLDQIYIQSTNTPPYPTLTILPGTTLEFNPAAGIRVAAVNSYPGQLVAEGTELSPITFTSFDGNPGGWSGIYFSNYSDFDGVISTMTWCDVIKGGANQAGFGFTANMKCLDTSQPTISHCSFNNSSNEGLILDGYSGSISDSRASVNGTDGIVSIDTEIQYQRVEVSGNGDDGFEVSGLRPTIGAGPVATCLLYGNTGYDVHVASGAEDVLASFNYWGTLDSTEIEAGIWDLLDDPALGRVLWTPAVDLGGGSNVSLTLTPYHTPTVIGPGGGYFRYLAQIHNQEAYTVQIDAWTELILPNGTTYGPIDLYTGLSLPSGYTLNAAPFQELPGYAPTGTYQFVGKIGTYPLASDSASFEVLKIELPLADQWFNGWASYGWFGSDDADMIAELEADASAPQLPTEFEIGQVYPNPFNAMANIQIALPEASQINVVIYNVNGRQITTVSNSEMPAGYHTLAIDGSRLASGVYFVRIDVPGVVQLARKIMLMK